MLQDLLDRILVSLLIGLTSGLIAIYFLKGNNNSSKIDKSDVSAGLRKEELASVTEKSSDDRVLNPAVFKSFKILSITKVSHNTKMFRFEIPHGKPLGLAIGRHIAVSAEINGNRVIRSYTPISRPDQKGYFDLLIKSYDLGKLSPYMHELKVGGSVDMRGPVGRFKYTKNQYKKIGLIAGGTGITPCLQIVRHILECPDMVDDKTNLVLYFQNRTEEDILLRDVLDTLQSSHKDRLTVEYYVSNPQYSEFGHNNNGNGKKHHHHNSSNEIRGYITQERIQQKMSPSQCQLVCICGPSGFNNMMKKLLLELGHKEQESNANSGGIYVW